MRAALLVLLHLLQFSAAPAHSQPWAPPPPEVTRGTACGAPGVGVIPSTRTPTFGGQLLVREVGVPGLRVDEDGGWTPCEMPPPPSDCPGESSRIRWEANGNLCEAGDVARGTLAHGTAQQWQAAPGATWGVLMERCDDGRRVQVISTCAPEVAKPPPVPAPPPPRKCGPQLGTLELVPWTYSGKPLAVGKTFTFSVTLRCQPDSSFAR